MKTFHTFKGCETKSIATAIIHLHTCEFIKNDRFGTAKIILHDTNDQLLVEALNQITTVEAILLDNSTIITNESRYLWKLNPENKENKFRLKLLRMLKPIGMFFLIRNIYNKQFLKLNIGEFTTFEIKCNSIYTDNPISYEIEHDIILDKNYYNIFLTNLFNPIIETVIDKYVIDDTIERKENKIKILNETISKLTSLINC